ncbi:unnamed protein product [Jaminaea pallidilutea]
MSPSQSASPESIGEAGNRRIAPGTLGRKIASTTAVTLPSSTVMEGPLTKVDSSGDPGLQTNSSEDYPGAHGGQHLDIRTISELHWPVVALH